MAHMDELGPKKRDLIIALLHHRTKAEAARAAGVTHRTMYRWFEDEDFMAALRAARRQAFDGAMFALERNAERAALVLADELGENRTDNPNLINAATRLLDRAFRAQTVVAVEEELEKLRRVLAALQAGDGGPPVAVDASGRDYSMIVAMKDEQAEAVRLRIAWLGELGIEGREIEASLRCHPADDAAEERQALEIVGQLLESERQVRGDVAMPHPG